jgi:hypothetical protein
LSKLFGSRVDDAILISFQGDAFGFMKLCAFIITELKNLSAASRAQQQQQMQQQTR